MSYILTNAPAIVLATIASLVIGALYRLSLSAGTIARAALSTTGFIMLTFSAELWLASILAGALILAPGGGSPWVMALASAVVIWIGFVFPTLLITLSYRSQPLGRFARRRVLAGRHARAGGGAARDRGPGGHLRLHATAGIVGIQKLASAYCECVRSGAFGQARLAICFCWAKRCGA